MGFYAFCNYKHQFTIHRHRHSLYNAVCAVFEVFMLGCCEPIVTYLEFFLSLSLSSPISNLLSSPLLSVSLSLSSPLLSSICALYMKGNSWAGLTKGGTEEAEVLREAEDCWKGFLSVCVWMCVNLNTTFPYTSFYCMHLMIVKTNAFEYYM